MGTDVTVAVNPAAGGGRAARVATVVTARLRAAGHRVEDVTCADARDALGRARTAVAGGAAALVVVGGDGMVHLAAQACAGTPTRLGVVPAGTGNDVARGLDLPLGDPDAAVGVLLGALAGPGRTVDALRVAPAARPVPVGGPPTAGERWCVGVLSAGFDAVVNERANSWRWPRGRMRYNLAILRELPVFRPLRYRLVLDGVVEEVDAMLVAVANGPSFGGGMRVAPDARFDDGLADVLVLGPVSTTELVRVFPRVYRGTHVTHPQVSIRRARTVEVRTLDRPVVAYGDGERLMPLPVTCTVVPGALHLLAPDPPRP